MRGLVLVDLKLFRYYSRLVSMGVGVELAVTLADVAESLVSSVRHARTLLNNMNDLGWLSWTPKVGRNQRSLLFLHYDLDQLQVKLAEGLISEEKYDSALAVLDGDHCAFGLVLQQTSGATLREGRLHVQLTYKRRLSSLLPHIPQRNSERFLLRQIYSCLVSCDENGRLHAQLAHYWKCDEKALRWTFYLRPGLTFHDGKIIDAQEIAALFSQMKKTAEYDIELAHVNSVSALQPLCVEFELNSTDSGFGALLADVKFSIQPAPQLSKTSQALVVGSGPFQVTEHSDERLLLQAFERFYGCRVFADKVTIWLLGSNSKSFSKALIKQKTRYDAPEYQKVIGEVNCDSAQLNKNAKHSRIEDGCLFILSNQRKYCAGSDPMPSSRLAGCLDVHTILDHLKTRKGERKAVAAFNFLPDWVKINIHKKMEAQPLPSHIEIAVYDQNALINCANAVSDVLKLQGVSCNINRYSYASLYQNAVNNNLEEDLILLSVNLDDNRPSSAYLWFLADPLLHHCLSAAQSERLRAELINIRSTRAVDTYMDELESLATSMIYEGCMLPLLHSRQTLQFDGVLEGVKITCWGWPAIQEVWSTD